MLASARLLGHIPQSDAPTYCCGGARKKSCFMSLRVALELADTDLASQLLVGTDGGEQNMPLLEQVLFPLWLETL